MSQAPLTTSILVFTTLLMLTYPARAQETPEETDQQGLSITYGAALLANFSDISYSDPIFNEPFSKKLGFGGGARAILEFHPNFSIQPELLYIQRGMTSQIAQFPDDEEGVNSERRTYTFHYVQLPLLARAQIMLTDTVGLHAVAGPSVMFFLNRTARAADGTVTDTDRGGLRLFHFAAAAGAGIDVDFDFGTLSLDLRYDRSLNSFTSEESIAHTAFSFLVGFSL